MIKKFLQYYLFMIKMLVVMMIPVLLLVCGWSVGIVLLADKLGINEYATAGIGVLMFFPIIAPICIGWVMWTIKKFEDWGWTRFM